MQIKEEQQEAAIQRKGKKGKKNDKKEYEKERQKEKEKEKESEKDRLSTEKSLSKERIDSWGKDKDTIQLDLAVLQCLYQLSLKGKDKSNFNL